MKTKQKPVKKRVTTRGPKGGEQVVGGEQPPLPPPKKQPHPLSGYSPRDLARYGIERLASLYKEVKGGVTKRELERDMEITAAEAVYELKAMGRELEDTDETDTAIRKIKNMQQRGAFAVDKDLRESGVHDLAKVLQAAIEALAVLAVKHKSLDAVRYLAWRSDLGRHRLPEGATQPLEEAIKAMGGDLWKAWQKSVKARARHGKQRPRKGLGEWVRKLWSGFEQWGYDVIVDSSNRAVGFPDVPSAQVRWDAYRAQHDLPADIAPTLRDPAKRLEAHFADAIVMPLLKWIGEDEQRQCCGKKCSELWGELIGTRYTTASGAPDWSKIKKQVVKALEEPS